MSSAADTPADGGAAAAPRRQLNCLGKAIVAFLDGASLGAAIGGIISGAQAVGGLSSGTETVGSAIRHVGRSALRSGLSIGGVIAGYTGGVCSLERLRSKRDVANPFLVGGVLGAASTLRMVEHHDGRNKVRALSLVPRAMVGAGLSSALLCSLFWSLQQPSRREREERVAREISTAEAKVAAELEARDAYRAGAPPGGGGAGASAEQRRQLAELRAQVGGLARAKEEGEDRRGAEELRSEEVLPGHEAEARLAEALQIGHADDRSSGDASLQLPEVDATEPPARAAPTQPPASGAGSGFTAAAGDGGRQQAEGGGPTGGTEQYELLDPWAAGARRP